MINFSDIKNPLLAILYPQCCALCGASVEAAEFGDVCAACWDKTEIFDGSEIVCYRCGVVLNSAGTLAAERKIFCHGCDEFAFEAARAVGVYAGALRQSILRLKREPFISDELKDLFVKAREQPPLNQATAIAPIPLHAKRQRERGFNQAEVLAECLSQKSGLPLLKNCLIRHAHTQIHRAGMDERGRRESVEKSFAVKNARLIAGEKILLVDDVLTTGATVSACAQILKENGAGDCYVLTIARAV